MTHIIAEAYDTLQVGTPLSRIPKPLVFGERFNPLYKSELIDFQLVYTCFYKSDEECHHNMERIWSELEGNHIKMLKHSLDKTVKG